MYNLFNVANTEDNEMIKAGIIGATGYAGNEIARLLLGHKEVEVAWYGSNNSSFNHFIILRICNVE